MIALLMPGPQPDFLQVDPASTLQDFNTKQKEIEH
jgi:hypothetical protein